MTYRHNNYAWCRQQIGKRERRCTGRYMYMHVGTSGDIEFFWGKEHLNGYATLTPNNVLTIDHKYTSSVWLQNHIWRIFGVHICSEAATHRNHKYRIRLHAGADLPWVNGTQFHGGDLLPGRMEELRALDVVRRTDRTKAKAAREKVKELKAVLFTLVRLNVQPVELPAEMLSALRMEDGYYYDTDKVLAFMHTDADPAQKMAVLSKLARPWYRSTDNYHMKLGWTKLEKALLEKEGAFYYAPTGLTDERN